MNILEILTTIWAFIGANPWLTAFGGVLIAIIANKAGYVLPEAWRKKIFDGAVAALAKLLGVTVEPNLPVSDSRDEALLAVDNFMELQEQCKGCPQATDILKQLWVHLQPGHHETDLAKTIKSGGVVILEKTK